MSPITLSNLSLKTFLTCFVLSSLAACGDSGPEAEPEPKSRVAKLITITAQEKEISLSLPAVIDASLTSDLTFEVPGRVEVLAVEEGDEIEKGTLIARLNQRDYNNQLSQAKAQYQSAQVEYDRAVRLIEEDAIAQSVVDQRKTTLDVARASLEIARKRMDDTRILAPFSGVIAVRHVEQYENVGAQQPIVTLQTTGDAQAVVQVPARIIANIDKIQVVDSVVELDVLPNLKLPAELYSASTKADSATQTFEVKLKFSPPSDTHILPGMTGTVTTRFIQNKTQEEQDELITIPMSSILSEGGINYVWIVNMDTMQVAKREVTIIQDQTTTDIAVDGVFPGETIVGAGAAHLHEGMTIRPYN